MGLFIFDHSKYGWDIVGIVNIAFELLNNQPHVALLTEPFTMQNWGKFPQQRIRISHSFVNGLLKTDWCVVSGKYEQIDNKTFWKESIVERHNANSESLIDWLWDHRNYLLVDQSTVGWDNNKKEFVKKYE